MGKRILIGSEAAVGKAIADAYAIARKEGWLDNFIALFRKKNRILVLGSSGAGKTQFIRSLKDQVPALVALAERTEFIEKNKLEVDGNLFEFIEAPGDLSKSAIRDEQFEKAKKSQYDLIVNIVCFGYHEYSQKSGELAVLSNGSMSSEHLTEHQEIEIELLYEWCEKVSQKQVAKRVLTVATKADLWWDDRDAVVAGYKSGEYGEMIKKHGFEHAVAAYSSSINRPFGVGNISATFDEAQKYELRRLMFQLLFSSIGQKKT